MEFEIISLCVDVLRLEYGYNDYDEMKDNLIKAIDKRL